MDINLNHQLDTDVAIIGAGPVGLFTVFQCGMLGFRCHVIDVLDEIGGQCTALYPDKPIYDIPAHPEINAQELINQLIEQARPFKPIYHLGRPVKKLTQLDNNKGPGWELEITAEKKITTRAVIVAGGSGAFGPVRLPLSNVAEFEGRSLFYSVQNKSEFEGKRIVIAGGGDSAVDWALALKGVASRISVVHRRNKFRAFPDNVKKMYGLAEKKLIDMIIPYQISSIKGGNGLISEVCVSTLSGEEKTIEADIVLAFFGLVNQLGPIAEWGLELDKHSIVVSPDTCQTNRSGIFAVGDIASYPGKLKLILTGFSEAALAAHAIHPLIYPGKELHFEYSTNQGVPGR